jgi:DNA-binding XRE family transcriptional regulator
MVARGRQGWPKVVQAAESTVVAIRTAYHDGMSAAFLGTLYQMSADNVQMIARGDTWQTNGGPRVPAHRTVSPARLIALRQARGWTQADLARFLDRDVAWLNRLERGKIKSGVITNRALAKLFNIPLEELFS